MGEPLDVLIVGLGQMGKSHARGYQKLDGWNISGIVARDRAKWASIAEEFPEARLFDDFATALAELKPDAVSVNTYPDSHAEYAIAAMEAGAHVFVEKPLASTLEDAQRMVDAAKRHNRKLVVGYILNHHPAWKKFVEFARQTGTPKVMRMNLLQQSSGEAWAIHKKMLGAGLQPIVDCGIHYVEIMCQMTQSRPVKVNAMGVRLSAEVAINNYGQLQLEFDDGSIGWYEAAYGPSISETAFFVKDVFGPDGSVSIANKPPEPRSDGKISASAEIEGHTQADYLLVHRAALNDEGAFAAQDEWVEIEDNAEHEELCLREQAHLYDAIVNDIDLSAHLDRALDSLRIVLAADESTRTGQPVTL